ncbi:unnamed protein product, partial [Didymodactylos carnosus]
DNYIDFKEFLIAYVLTSIGEVEDKLEYAFSLFDIDQSKTIELKEMSDLIAKLLCITSKNTLRNYNPEIITIDVFKKFDLDHDNILTKEE